MLQEELYFLFLNSYGDFDEFAKAISAVLDDRSKGRYSFYYVFGNYDILIRLWLRRNVYNELLAELRNQCRFFNGSLEQFNVDRIFYVWLDAPFALQPQILDLVSQDQIRKVQAGDEKLFRELSEKKIILSDLDKRPKYGSDSLFKSFMVFEFLRESSSIIHIVQDELLTELPKQFPNDKITLYFGTGLGTLLLKQHSNEMQQFLALGDFIRKKLRLLRVRTSTYIVGDIQTESDNGDLYSEGQGDSSPLSDEADKLVKRYPDAKSLRVDDLYVAIAINERALVCAETTPDFTDGFDLLIRSFLTKNRGQLIQSILFFADKFELLRKESLPRLCQRAFESEWETNTNEFIRDVLKKSKPYSELSLGELLHFVRYLNTQKINDPRLDREWEELASRFVSIRNEAVHKSDGIRFNRVYEILLALEGASKALTTIFEVASQEGA